MNTRYIAIKSLSEIFAGEKPKDILNIRGSALDERERAFLMELVYGVLRNRDLLDWRLKKFLNRPAGLSEETINNLRLAIYQLMFMRVPEWATVDEAVNIEKSHKGRPPLLNAVLRSYIREIKKGDIPLPEDPVRRIATATSHPDWMVRRWVRRLGAEEAEALCRSNNETPPLVIRADIERQQALQSLEAAGIEAEACRYSPAGILIKGRDADNRRVTPQHIPLDPASYVIQDEAAQLVSYIIDPQQGERVLDACAAPGGKTTHMARLMGDKGEVIALDIAADRIKRLNENIARLGLKSVKVQCADIRKDSLEGKFDRILIDAPCSSIGVIRRNPDVKYRHTEADLKRFGETQLGLLKAAAAYLKPGGRLVYSVCSTEPEEGESVVSAFLQASADFSIIDSAPAWLAGFRAGESGYRTWPHKEAGMDGFFAVGLEKKSEK